MRSGNREDGRGPFLGPTLVTGIYTYFTVVRNILRDSGVARFSDFLAAPSIFATHDEPVPPILEVKNGLRSSTTGSVS
jgi:hypothetical protein